MIIPLAPREAGGGAVTETGPGAWRLSIPPGPAGQYRWAQIDDYLHLPRGRFAWRAPVTVQLEARISGDPAHAGTWGFGLWNDPFSASLGLGGAARRLPVLPNTAWFFYAAPPNYLASHDDHPAQGFLCATFSARTALTALAYLGAPLAPLLAVRPVARPLRRAAAGLIRESGHALAIDATAWHTYRMTVHPDAVRFWVDSDAAFRTAVAPRGRLGLVIWIDNQYAAFRQDGGIGMGTLATPQPVALEVRSLSVDVQA